MHGGLTAAIVDESFGFLWLSLRSNGQLPFRGPAFTAHLEVDYKQVWTITNVILHGLKELHWIVLSMRSSCLIVIKPLFGSLITALPHVIGCDLIATGLTPSNGVQKIPAGRLLLCTTEVESCEGRKLWMKATVRDGPSGKVSRPAFIPPNGHRCRADC